MQVGAKEIVVGGSGAGIDGRDIVSVVGGVVKSCEVELAPVTQVRVDEDHVGSVFWFDLELETGTPAAAPGVVGNVGVGFVDRGVEGHTKKSPPPCLHRKGKSFLENNQSRKIF